MKEYTNCRKFDNFPEIVDLALRIVGASILGYMTHRSSLDTRVERLGEDIVVIRVLLPALASFLHCA